MHVRDDHSGPPRPSLHYPAIPFHGLLEQAADRLGEEPGLLYEDEQYTFRELDGFANSFARALQARGDRPGRSGRALPVESSGVDHRALRDPEGRRQRRTPELCTEARRGAPRDRADGSSHDRGCLERARRSSRKPGSCPAPASSAIPPRDRKERASGARSRPTPGGASSSKSTGRRPKPCSASAPARRACRRPFDTAIDPSWPPACSGRSASA